MTKHRSRTNRSDRAEKAALSRHLSLRAQETVADSPVDAPDLLAESPKTVEVAFVGHPLLGEYRAVPHGW